MSDSEKYLKGHDLTGDINIPQLDLSGNYIAYKDGPASPDNEGVEGWVKMAPDGIFFYSDGRWRKTPAYTYNWDELAEDVRFLPLNKEIHLSDQEKLYLQEAFGMDKATQSKLGIVKGSARSQAYGAIQINIDGSAVVPPATTQYSGTVRVTDIDSSGNAPIVATKAYVDSRITSDGLVVPRATFDNIGGIKLGGDIIGMDSQGRISVAKASHTSSHIQSYGLVRIAPPEFTIDAASDAYDDSAQDIPYVVTVSQAKNVATKAMQAYSIPIQDYIATTTVAGFVKPGQGLRIQDDGTLTVNTASISNSGTVMLYDYSEGSTSDPTTTLPTMQVVMDYIDNLDYITEADLPTAGTSKIGCIKYNAAGPIKVDVNGLISIDNAGVGQPGVVALAGAAPYGQNTVLTAQATNQLIQEAVQPTIATETTAGVVKVALGTGDITGDVQQAYTVPTENKVGNLIGAIYTSESFKNGVNAQVTAYFENPVEVPIIFQDDITFSQPAGSSGTSVIFSNIAPQITGAAGDVKPDPEDYQARDILNCQQIKDLIQSGSITPPAPEVPWAEYDADVGSVTITSEQLNIDSEIRITGKVVGNVTLDGTTAIDAPYADAVFNSVQTPALRSGENYLNIGVSGQTTLISLQKYASSPSGTITLNGNVIVGGNTLKVNDIESYSGSSPISFGSDINLGISNGIIGSKFIKSTQAEFKELNVLSPGSFKAQAMLPIMGAGIPRIPQEAMNYDISIELYTDNTKSQPVYQDNFRQYGTNPFELLVTRITSSTRWNEYFSEVVFQGSYSNILFAMKTAEEKYNGYFIEVTIYGDDLAAFSYLQSAEFEGAVEAPQTVARIQGDAK